jgi:hypothetical protein
MHIAYDEQLYTSALHEQKMRSPYMLTKYADSPARKAGQLRGLVVEQHVSHWFRNQFPKHYLPPDNFEQWTKVCSHDFKLMTPERTLLIDISGPKKNGTFGSYSMKPSSGVDFHIITRIVSFTTWDDIDYQQGFEIVGIVSPHDYTEQLDFSRLINLESWLATHGLS